MFPTNQKSRKSLHFLWLSLACWMPLGCQTQGGAEQTTHPNVQVAGEWNGRLDGVLKSADLDPKVLARWWETLGDPLLNNLIDQATAANPDLRSAKAQWKRARAERKIAESKGKPTVAASGSAVRSGTSGNAGLGTTQDLYGASLDAAWELDLFGQQAAERVAATADLQAVQESTRDVYVSLMAELALNYIDLRTLQRRAILMTAQVELLKEFHRIVTAQRGAGVVTDAEVDTALANLSAAQAGLPALTQQIEQLKNRITVSVGKAPGELGGLFEPWQALPLPEAIVAVGVPAEVLRRRPDVRMAERRLAAETARVGVAQAELYPKFTLVGTIGLESLSFGSLFESASRAFGLGPRVEWTPFDGGRTRSQIEIQNAVQEQALIEYEKAILTALEDVENSISAFMKERIRNESLKVAAAASERAADNLDIQYRAGEVEFLQTVDSQRAFLNSQDELAQSNGQLVWNLVRLYKALGGGWDPSEGPSERSIHKE